MTDVVGNPEEERRADFFHLPWSQEAVCRYFYGKVNNGRLTLMVVKCVSLGKSKSGFLIQDHSDHGVSKEPTNPLRNCLSA